jgi:hypothetical protein
LQKQLHGTWLPLVTSSNTVLYRLRWSSTGAELCQVLHVL